jgi:4-methyl-5(b-hydroxyethyl)-thiazole monophosphate biosynthesis
MKALVPLADGCEEMEAVIIIDVLRRAEWEVAAVGLKPGAIRASRGVSIVPDASWDEIDPDTFDLIVLPGGNGGTENLAADERVLSALRRFHEQGKVVAAVCAGPLVLQAAGVLSGKRATCYPSAAPGLTEAEHVDERVVVDGQVITSQGPGTSFEFALALVRHFDGPEKARTIGQGMVLG